ncbi:MAG: GNAT family N-acetyltransferase [Candidatus Thorarchaeota archaeon]
MSSKTRTLTPSDSDDVLSISSSVWETDYVPNSFLKWIEDPLWHPIGVFEEEKLVSYGALHLVEGTDYAWINALRTHKDVHRKGYGFEVVHQLILRAKELGVKELRYATSSRNSASMTLAIKAGFELIDTVGYARIHKPYPAHPKPSPNLIPLKADAERVFEVLGQNPELIPTKLIPMAWEFYDKDLKGLERIGEDAADFFLVISDDGTTQGLYITHEFERDGQSIMAYTVYCQERAMFIDIIARALEHVESREIDRSVFFLGPNGTDWIKYMAILPEDWDERNFLLYRMNL